MSAGSGTGTGARAVAAGARTGAGGVAPYRSKLPPARAGFRQLLRAEFTKLRSVDRWLLTLLAGVVVTVLVSLVSAGGSEVATSDDGGGSGTGAADRVADSFRFVHRPLAGDGSVTARVTDLTLGEGTDAPWAKAGVIVKAGTEPGSPYVALMRTAGHGVRLQYGFEHDVAGGAVAGDAPVWLRLTREGDRLTGYRSADGERWQEVGGVSAAGLPRTARAGLFVAAPETVRVERSFGSLSIGAGPSEATGVFDNVRLEGAGSGSGPGSGPDSGSGSGSGSGDGDGGGGTAWRDEAVGPPSGPAAANGPVGGAERTGGTFTVTGSGDIGPRPPAADLTWMSLAGAQVGLIAFAALGVVFITAEYRRGMIRTTFTAGPRRGRVLAAKATVLGAVTCAAGLAAAVVSFLAGQRALRSGGHTPPQFPEVSLSDGPALRAVVGTGLLLALVALFALGLGALLRHTAAAVTLVVVLFVLPMVLGGGLPLGAVEWLFRVTPVAGFGVQSTTPRYGQVETVCVPEDGCMPQGPWAGLGVLAVWAAVALALAAWRLRRRDA
ncbi:ABC transporter permease subunit [Streptomyces sp. WMMC500]|uniref:ABC transporter permease subunit n=1 Tax=Streptomyces sp. WMMC500 TaxID=3015154 RepID=UPI00248AAFA5|nr:ABC transporter permease subunit [Streptomyces sp. WMMC500]WBB57998.1 ABC transporter permease subunit [Streptomyces sp. WMMC500]